jgi:hypothetical protein
LQCFELFEHILVVQDGVRELILEDIFLQKFPNSLCNDGVLEDLVYIGSQIGVLLEHGR